MNASEIQQEIFTAVREIFNLMISRTRFNYTVEGRVTAVNTGNTYDVIINGDTYSGIHSVQDSVFAVDDVVRILVYNNNSSDMEILSEIRR